MVRSGAPRATRSLEACEVGHVVGGRKADQFTVPAVLRLTSDATLFSKGSRVDERVNASRIVSRPSSCCSATGPLTFEIRDQLPVLFDPIDFGLPLT